MFGKAAILLLRLCGVLHCIKQAIKFLKEKNLNDCSKRNLTNEFILSVENHFKTTVFDITNIETDIVYEAEELLTYFNKNRIILAGYEINFDEIDFYSAIHNCIIKLKNVGEISLITINKNNMLLYEKILCSPGQSFRATKICQKNRKSVQDFVQACRELEDLNLGKTETFKGSNARDTYMFVKKSLEEIENDLNFVIILKKLRIDIRKFKDSYIAEGIKI